MSTSSWESGKHEEKRWGFFGALFSAGWERNKSPFEISSHLIASGDVQVQTVHQISPESLSPWSCLPSLIFSAIRCPLVGGHTGAFSVGGRLRSLVLPSLIGSGARNKISKKRKKHYLTIEKIYIFLFFS